MCWEPTGTQATRLPSGVRGLYFSTSSPRGKERKKALLRHEERLRVL